jgi:hypothetical protein
MMKHLLAAALLLGACRSAPVPQEATTTATQPQVQATVAAVAPVTDSCPPGQGWSSAAHGCLEIGGTGTAATMAVHAEAHAVGQMGLQLPPGDTAIRASGVAMPLDSPLGSLSATSNEASSATPVVGARGPSLEELAREIRMLDSDVPCTRDSDCGVQSYGFCAESRWLVISAQQPPGQLSSVVSRYSATSRAENLGRACLNEVEQAPCVRCQNQFCQKIACALASPVAPATAPPAH